MQTLNFPRQPEKLKERITVPMTETMKTDVMAMIDDGIVVHEMIRDFMDTKIKEWKQWKAQHSSPAEQQI